MPVLHKTKLGALRCECQKAGTQNHYSVVTWF